MYIYFLYFPTRYVRCIKPNGTKKPDSFVDKDVILQLSYSGMLDIIRIKREVSVGAVTLAVLLRYVYLSTLPCFIFMPSLEYLQF